MNAMCRHIVLPSLLLLALPAALAAQVSTPQAVRLVGYLTVLSDGEHEPANGTYSMKFDLYDDEFNGALLGSHGPADVTVEDGHYDILLEFGADLFDGKERWIEITVNGEVLRPRIRVTSGPFAYVADKLDGYEGQDLEESEEIEQGDQQLQQQIDDLDSRVDELEQNGDGGNTLDEAYDEGGPGAGRTIHTESGKPVEIRGQAGLDVEEKLTTGSLRLRGEEMIVGTAGSGRLSLTEPSGGTGWFEVKSVRVSGNAYDAIEPAPGNLVAEGTIEAGQDMTLGNFTFGQRFILHSRAHVGGDFLQLTYDDPQGNWVWSEGIWLLRNGGKVGIGTSNPSGKLGVHGDLAIDLRDFTGPGGRDAIRIYASDDNSNGTITINKPTLSVWSESEGRSAGLDIGDLKAYGSATIDLREFSGSSGRDALTIYASDDNDNGTISVNKEALRIWSTTENRDATLRVGVLEITGGADIAEPFSMTGGVEVPAGTVVSIDAAHPGYLRIADTAYDRCVAGIVSGAGGVRPGVTLSQRNALEGETMVAVTGRVYALASAENGPIAPGDLLTTASTPGHVMRVTDPVAAQGAIIGKAMTALDEGTGLVLVLVNLQ